MATEVIQADASPVGRDVLPTASAALGASTVPMQINPYVGISAEPFTMEQSSILLQRLDENEVEIRPDGLVYLPEIRYRRILNTTFGPGAWALMPRSIDISDNMLYYRGALFVHGRFVSEAIGEQQYHPNNDRMSYATAAESAKSNCLVRCCKDIGIASELWDPSFTRGWLKRNAVEVWCVNRQDTSKRKKFWRKVSAPAIDMWPWQEMEEGAQPRAQTRTPREDRTGTPAPVQKDPATPASPPMAGAFGDARLISPKQAGRFHAISRVHNWKERELQRLLAQHRFASVEDVTRDAYEALCNALADEARLEAIRKDIDREEIADDVLHELRR